jgi:hypothetical protein
MKPLKRISKGNDRVVTLCAYLFFILAIVGSCKNDPDPKPVVDEITPEARMEILKACEEKFASLRGKAPAEKLKEMTDWLKEKPEFLEAGYDAEMKNAWGIFNDGRFLMIADNLQPASVEEQKDFPPEGGRNEEIPNAKKVLLMSGMGTAFYDPRFIINQYFLVSKTAYKAERKKATVDELKAVNEEIGVFYLYTHGARAVLKDSLKYKGKSIPLEFSALWTSDSRSVENDNKFKDDLDSYRLGYMLADNDKNPFGKVMEDTHYAITDRFIEKYMSFGENSLLYVDACGSFTPKLANTFTRKAKKGRATYVGWTAPALIRDMHPAAHFLFGRMLGVDAGFPEGNREKPVQRPFDIDDLMTDLQARGFGKSTTDDGIATLRYSSTGVFHPAILTPSIAYLKVDELDSKLTINGIFGDDPRKNGGSAEVTVNGKNVTSIDTWENEKIECTIPHKGNGAAGDVIVKAWDHQSNAVPLTEWYVEFLWLEKGQQVKREATITLHLRADVHRYRRKPGENDPKRVDDTTPYYVFAKDSKAIFTASGSCSYVCPCNPGQRTDSNTIVGPDSVSLPYNMNGTSATNSFFAFYNWDAERTTVSTYAFGSDFDSYQEKVVSGGCTGGGSTTSTPLPFAFSVSDGLSDKKIDLKMINPDGFDFRIQEGERSFGTIALEYCQCFGSPEVPIKLTWKESVPRFAPTENTHARVQRE